MREPQSKQIGSAVFKVTPLGASKARALSVKLMRMAGAGIGGVSSLDETGMLALVGAVFAHANEGDIEAVITILAESTQIEQVAGSGSEIPLTKVMEVHFAGAFDEQVQWVAFALKVHIGPLVDWLKSIQPTAPPRASSVASSG